VERIASRLLDEVIGAFNARGGALYLQTGSGASPTYSHGRMNGEAVIDVHLRHQGQPLGRLVLGSRRGDIAYSTSDREALQRSADSVGEALALAAQLGLRPLATFNTAKEMSR
jgi:hypothetical protein